MTAGERPVWVDDRLFPFDSQFVEVDGNVVHYVDEGSGPTLLMLHGNPTWSFLWRDVIRILRDNFRCVALDYPGFGLSTAKPGYRFRPEEHADVVAAFAEALGIDTATLVAQDWGGPIGLGVERRRPGTFDRLVLADTWAWPTNGDLYFEAFSRIAGSRPLRALAHRFGLVVDLFVPAGHRRRAPTEAEMAHYRRAQDTPGRRRASAILPHCITASREFFTAVESTLGDVSDLPTLILWGGADRVFRDVERVRLEAALPHHRTVIVDGAGLYVESDAPDEFAAAIVEWSAELGRVDPC
ncbi:alpha/beta fold hydrolase [Gordonia sp. L191]|uniref:alpha/beta fold hydrolase n=1 Tax=Gordonia sp. L191 TaxID=2982699 RepID=UPI0024C0D146|nr:alpha/beta fold hydrolase [Gordonia sp. L191]WHU49313.1 alpha/beta fold hydrolase [Gordonia sp. L191]